MKKLFTCFALVAMLAFAGCGTFGDDNVGPNGDQTEQPNGNEDEKTDEGEKPNEGGDENQNPDTPKQYKIYVYNAVGWEPLNIYMWRWDDEDLTEYVGAWSGAQVEETEVINGFTYYVYDLPTEANGKEIGVIFNNGSGLQTPDWFITVDKDYYVFLSGTSTPTIIEDKNNPIENGGGNENPDDGDNGNEDGGNDNGDYSENQKIYYTSTDGNIVEPNNTSGFYVNIISNTYESGQGVIVFDGDVTSIGESAFSSLYNLASITIPEGVTSIGRFAFRNCSNLASINIPNGVTSISGSVFSGCSSLTSITIPEGVTSIGDYAFEGCTSLTSIHIPEGVTRIGVRAFADCTNSMLSITIPESVTSLSVGSTFENCTGELIMKSKVVEYSDNHGSSFGSSWSSAKFRRVVIGDNITKIGAGIFSKCHSIKEIDLGNGIQTIESYAFYNNNGLKDITIPDSVTSIGEDAFAFCYSLIEVNFPNNVNHLEFGIGAFTYCEALKSINIPNGVTTVSSSCFAHCASLANITIPNSVTDIQSSAFEFTGLTNIDIPDSVITIGERAFMDCSNLEEITIGDGCITIGNEAFAGVFNDSWCNIKTATIGKSVTSIGNEIFWQRTIEELTINGKFIEADHEHWYSFPDHCYHWYDRAKIQNVIIGDNVTRIGDSAFYGDARDDNWAYLQNVTLPETIEEIGAYAFMSCLITSIIIPKSVTSIKDYAFAYCPLLTEVYCKPTTPPQGGVEMFSNPDPSSGGNGEWVEVHPQSSAKIFSNTDSITIYVPAGSEDEYRGAEFWKNYSGNIKPW